MDLPRRERLFCSGTIRKSPSVQRRRRQNQSSHRRSSLQEIDFERKIASGICACVQTMIGLAMARSRQPVAIRSI